MATNLTGKVVLVTGATAGIGEVTARELARMGATVVGIGRNPQKCADVAASIRSQTGNQAVEYLVADLSSMHEIIRVTDEFRSKYQRLDLLINNAGAYFQQHKVSVDGFEMTFALNHMNYFLVTRQLLDMLKANAPSRIVNVASAAHTAGKLDFADLQMTQKYGSWRAYANSKFANVVFTYELARRLQGSGVTANTLHPGFVASDFAMNNNQSALAKVILAIFKPLRNLVAISVDKGAETQIFLATSPTVEGVSGKYFDKKQAVKSAPLTYDEATGRQLWQVSEELLQGLSIIS